MPAQKVVIMTVPYGGGHYAMAERLKELLLEYRSDIEVEILDVLTDGWPAFSRSSSSAYTSSTDTAGGFWFRIWYHLTDICPWPLRWFAVLAFGRYAARKFPTFNADLVIATFPFLGHVATRARARIHGSTPIVTTITDAGRVQGVWLCGKEDVIMPATADTVPYAIKRGAAPERLHYGGFPVAKVFYELSPADVARQQLGLRADVYTVLVASGGYGMNPSAVRRLMQELQKVPGDLQVVCVCGKNEQLKAELEQQTAGDDRFQIVGYTHDMPNLVAAADIVCSKSGWLTISEVLVARRPLLLYSVVPGQEQENARFVTTHGYGTVETDPQKAVALVLAAKDNPSVVTRASEPFSDRASRQQLADYLLEIADGQIHV